MEPEAFQLIEERLGWRDVVEPGWCQSAFHEPEDESMRRFLQFTRPSITRDREFEVPNLEPQDIRIQDLYQEIFNQCEEHIREAEVIPEFYDLHGEQVVERRATFAREPGVEYTIRKRRAIVNPRLESPDQHRRIMTLKLNSLEREIKNFYRGVLSNQQRAGDDEALLKFDKFTITQPLVLVRTHTEPGDKRDPFLGLYGALLEQVLCLKEADRSDYLFTIAQYNDYYGLLDNWGPRNFLSFIVLPPQTFYGYYGLCRHQPNIENPIEGGRNYHLANIDKARGGGAQLFIADAEIYRIGPYKIVPKIPYRAPWVLAPEDIVMQDVHTFMRQNRSSGRHLFPSSLLDITNQVFELREERMSLLQAFREEHSINLN